MSKSPRKKVARSRSSSSSSSDSTYSSSSGSSSESSSGSSVQLSASTGRVSNVSRGRLDVKRTNAIEKTSKNSAPSTFKLDAAFIGKIIIKQLFGKTGTPIPPEAMKSFVNALYFTFTCIRVEEWEKLIDGGSEVQSLAIEIIPYLVCGEGSRVSECSQAIQKTTVSKFLDSARVQNDIKLDKKYWVPNQECFSNWLKDLTTRLFNEGHQILAWILYKLWENGVDKEEEISFKNAEKVLGKLIVQKAKETNKLSPFKNYTDSIDVKDPLRYAIKDRIFKTVTRKGILPSSQLSYDLRLSEEEDDVSVPVDDPSVSDKVDDEPAAVVPVDDPPVSACSLVVALPEIVGSNQMKLLLANDKYKDVTWQSETNSKMLKNKVNELEKHLEESDDVVTLHMLEMYYLNQRSELLKEKIKAYEAALTLAKIREDCMRNHQQHTLNPEIMAKKLQLIVNAMSHYKAGKATARGVSRAITEYLSFIDDREVGRDDERLPIVIQNCLSESELVKKLLEELKTPHPGAKSSSVPEPMDTD